MTERQFFKRTVLGLLTSSIAVAALTGLLIAGRTMADVETLKTTQPAVEIRLRAVETQLSSLRGMVSSRLEADRESRERIQTRLDQIQSSLSERP